MESQRIFYHINYNYQDERGMIYIIEWVNYMIIGIVILLWMIYLKTMLYEACMKYAILIKERKKRWKGGRGGGLGSWLKKTWGKGWIRGRGDTGNSQGRGFLTRGPSAGISLTVALSSSSTASHLPHLNRYLSLVVTFSISIYKENRVRNIMIKMHILHLNLQRKQSQEYHDENAIKISTKQQKTFLSH